MFRLVRTLTVTLMCVLALGGQALGQGNRIVEAMETEPTNLDLFAASRRPEFKILSMIHEPLLAMNKSLEVEPLLAEAWSLSDDQLTLTLTLKDGIQFHDGTEFNADAVKFSLDLHRERGSHASLLNAVREIEVTSPLEVAIHLSTPAPLLLESLASYWLGMVSPEAYTSSGDAWGNSVLVGTGPYRFANWQSGDRIVLERNDAYNHGPSFVRTTGPAAIEQWVIRFIREPSTLLAELMSGNVDFSDYILEKDFDEVEAHRNTSAIVKETSAMTYLALNTGMCAPDRISPLTDVRVRRAMNFAIEKNAVIQAALAGHGTRGYASIAPTTVGYWPGADELGNSLSHYDPDRARQLLEEAGWVEGRNGVRVKDGQELTVELYAFTITRYSTIAQIAQAMLSDVGFRVNTNILEAGTLYEQTTAGQHDLLATGYEVSNGFALEDLRSTLHTDALGSVVAWSCYSNPEMDRLLDVANSDPDPQAREDALYAAQQLAIEDAVTIPLAVIARAIGYKTDRVGGVEEYTAHPWALAQADGLRALEFYILGSEE